jgi:hypothetical protein
MDPSSKPPRKVQIADHIWDAFEEMASQMGSERDALINQAMFMFARLNGFIESAGGGAAQARPAPSNGTPVPRPQPAPARPQRNDAPPLLKPVQSSPSSHNNGALDDDPMRREVQERVLETAAELEKLIKSKHQQNNQNAQSAEQEPVADVDVDMGNEPGGAPALYMMLEGGELDRIAKERFVIGRGKHCDFVINSGKVSREHAVIVRDGTEYFIEDLGSSNGTWFNKQRIKRRKVEDGDEYFICSEKVKFVYR